MRAPKQKKKGGLFSKLLKGKKRGAGKGRGSVVIDLSAVAEAVTDEYDMWTGNVPLVDLSYFSSSALENLPFFSVLTSTSTADRVRRRDKLIAKMKRKPVAEGVVDATRLDNVVKFFQWQQRPAGDVLFREGDMGDALWMIMEGKVQITRVGEDAADRDGADDGGGEEEILLAEISDGNWFGEIALTGRQFRSATATTTTPCIFLVLSQGKFDELRSVMPDVAAGMQRVISERKASTLKEVPFFELLDDAVLNSLAGLFTFEQFREDTVVFRVEDPGDEFFIIIEGSVKVTHFDDRGDELILSQLGRNEYFGEIALLHQCPRTAGVVTLENSTMLKLHRNHFESFRNAVPAIDRPFQRAVATRLARTLSKMPLFRTVKENKPWSKTDMLSEMFTYRRAKSDEVIIAEGDPPESFHIIVAGEAIATTVSQKGKVVELSRLGPGAWLGEIALLKKRLRTASVTATKPCLLLCLTRQNFARLMKAVPEVLEILKKSCEDRMAHSDLALSGKAGVRSENVLTMGADGAGHRRDASALPGSEEWPPRQWSYQDPQGAIHGPFQVRTMRAWWKQGYLSPMLPMRPGVVGRFRCLHEFFPDKHTAFAIDPERWEE